MDAAPRIWLGLLPFLLRSSLGLQVRRRRRSQRLDDADVPPSPPAASVGLASSSSSPGGSSRRSPTRRSPPRSTRSPRATSSTPSRCSRKLADETVLTGRGRRPRASALAACTANRLQGSSTVRSSRTCSKARSAADAARSVLGVRDPLLAMAARELPRACLRNGLATRTSSCDVRRQRDTALVDGYLLPPRIVFRRAALVAVYVAHRSLFQGQGTDGDYFVEPAAGRQARDSVPLLSRTALALFGVFHFDRRRRLPRRRLVRHLPRSIAQNPRPPPEPASWFGVHHAWDA